MRERFTIANNGRELEDRHFNGSLILLRQSQIQLQSQRSNQI
jgi:hypothetical protein